MQYRNKAGIQVEAEFSIDCDASNLSGQEVIEKLIEVRGQLQNVAQQFGQGITNTKISLDEVELKFMFDDKQRRTMSIYLRNGRWTAFFYDQDSTTPYSTPKKAKYAHYYNANSQNMRVRCRKQTKFESKVHDYILQFVDNRMMPQ